MSKAIAFSLLVLATSLLFSSCRDEQVNSAVTSKAGEGLVPKPESPYAHQQLDSAYQVAFLIMDGVYNTELTAPWDIFHHTRFREGIKPMNVFSVANTRGTVYTFEGMKILPDYNYLTDELPSIDILVVPSAEHHLDTDLNDSLMIDFVRATGIRADYVTSHCDGAFVLAEAGLLDDRACTTFPSDIEAMRSRFPELDIREGLMFVHDGPVITSAGGARSFEAALYLCEHLYGADIARELAEGMVVDWDLSSVPHLVLEE